MSYRDERQPEEGSRQGYPDSDHPDDPQRYPVELVPVPHEREERVHHDLVGQLATIPLVRLLVDGRMGIDRLTRETEDPVRAVRLPRV